MRIWPRRRRRDAPNEPVPEPADTGGNADETDSGGGGGNGKGLLAETRDALKPVKKRHILIASLGLLGLGLGGMLLFSAFSFWWTSQPSFCNRCHVMNRYVDAWEQSSHRDVNCEECHIPPGLFSFLGGKIAGLQVVANYVSGNYEDWSFSAAIANASCLRCHDSILSGNVHDVSSGIVVSHADIVGRGGRCMSCHSTVAHGDAVPVGSATHPTMAKCLTCHNDVTAPLDCELCHIGQKPPSPNADMPTGDLP